MLLTDAEGTPVGVDVKSASPHEVTLIESLMTRSQRDLPKQCRLLYDKAADSEPLRKRLRVLGTRLIAPFRKWRGRPQRRLSVNDARHYANRWKVERTFSWLKRFRRLVVRWEYHAHLFAGFWHLGCLFTILKGL